MPKGCWPDRHRANRVFALVGPPVEDPGVPNDRSPTSEQPSYHPFRTEPSCHAVAVSQRQTADLRSRLFLDTDCASMASSAATRAPASTDGQRQPDDPFRGRGRVTV
jgi:hypothetical protein